MKELVTIYIVNKKRVAIIFEIRYNQCAVDNGPKGNELRLCWGVRADMSETQVMINCTLVACRGIHRLYQHKIQRSLAKSIVEHYEELSKYVLSITMPVKGVDECVVVMLVTVEAQTALQVVSSQFPVHSQLIVDFEIPEFLKLL